MTQRPNNVDIERENEDCLGECINSSDSALTRQSMQRNPFNASTMRSDGLLAYVGLGLRDILRNGRSTT
jgi:hypothetical protein